MEHSRAQPIGAYRGSHVAGVFTEASEFARSIQLGGGDEDSRGGRMKAEAPDMADDEGDAPVASGMASESAEPGVAKYLLSTHGHCMRIGLHTQTVAL